MPLRQSIVQYGFLHMHRVFFCNWYRKGVVVTALTSIFAPNEYVARKHKTVKTLSRMLIAACSFKRRGEDHTE